MVENITALIESINEMMAWLNANMPDKYDQQYQNLIKKRLELRTIKETLNDFPGIAAYGESQKGKSYLVSNLLQDNGRPFTVVGPDGTEYNYVSELNPPGDGQEATGVVTRFTSFKCNPSLYSKEYPVLMKAHSVHEIVTILSDAYHFDVTDYEQWDGRELEEYTEEIQNKYGSQPAVQSVVIEDDIIAIKNYLSAYVNGAQAICRSDYLDTLARVIRNVPIRDFAEVFQPLWHNQANVTDLFVRLLSVLEKLNFAKEVYLPMSAIEHQQVKPSTIMSVQCLQGIYMDDFKYTTPAYVRENGAFRCIPDFNRSHLSAICREVVLKVEERFLSCDMSYDVAMIPEETRQRISRLKFKRDLLSHADLLDFPGARSREHLLCRNLGNTDSNSGEHNMVKLLLRGKISFLFNYYSSARALNLLMFCHDTGNVAVTEMYQVVEKWINAYIGDSPAERKRAIDECGGTPPFFVISTKFNQSLVEIDQDPNKNSLNALNQRWTNRFNILYRDVFHAGSDVEWFMNWDETGSKFNNIFVLRDFKYSSVGGDGSNLYKGFGPNTPKETDMYISRGHYDNMRRTYIELLRNDNVLKDIVEDPELSWDLSASINNDGSVYIIDRLTKVASQLGALRNKQFGEVANGVRSQLVQILETVYQNPKGGDPILKTRRNVGQMRLAFDHAVNSDNYFFGHFVESLQTNIREMYKVVQEVLNAPNVTKSIHETHNWEVIRKELAECSTRDERIDKLCRMYGATDEEDLRVILSSINADLDEILKAGEPAPKMANAVAESALKAWEARLKQDSTAQTACGEVLGLTSFGLLRDRLFEAIDLCALDKKISEAIEPLTAVNNMANVNQYQVADTIASQINNFVKDWGYAYIPAAEKAEMEELDRDSQFRIFQTISEEDKKTYDEQELTSLFVGMMSEPSAMSNSFYNQYRRWFAYLTLAILRHEKTKGNVIKNPVANEKIGEVLNQVKAIRLLH